MIYEAIKNHNKYCIDEKLQGEPLLQAKIIRDADKLDNFRVKDTEKFENMFKYNPETIDYEIISPKVYETFMNCKQINVKDRITRSRYMDFVFSIYI